MDNYVYHDRKMMKWMPFNALLEQSDYLKELLYGKTRKEMPILSPDQEQDLNYQLETAYLFNSQIIVSYFQDGDILEITGVITRTDLFNKIIFIGNTEISAKRIININII
ncbi:MAG: YolD-like family protein [Candidatus Izimaplasma sp.]|nr:YolD-like family protein [Candidatus Izimaplasma bacterium]